MGAVGAVVRCSSGQLRVASARRLSSVRSALLAEAEALNEWVRLIPAGTQDHIVAETNCQVLVSLWKNRGIHRSEILTILNEVEELVASFTSFRLVLQPLLQLNNDLAWKTFYGKRFFKKLYK